MKSEVKQALAEIKETFSDLELKKDNLIILENFINFYIQNDDDEEEDDDDDNITVTEVNLMGFGKFHYSLDNANLIVTQATEAFIDMLKKNPNLALKRLTAC